MIIKIDIMKGDRYLKTIQYKHCEAFKLDLNDVIKFIEEKNPSLVGKPNWSAVLCGVWCKNSRGKEELTLLF